MPILKEKYKFSSMVDSNNSIHIYFSGIAGCVISGEISNILLFKNSSAKIEVDFFHGDKSPMMNVITGSGGPSTTMHLYPNKNVYANTVSTIVVLLMMSEVDDTLCIEYRDIDSGFGYDVVKTVVDEGIFETDDVFEINTLDRFDEMYVYDIRTGKMMSNVHVPGNWIKSIFEKEES